MYAAQLFSAHLCAGSSPGRFIPGEDAPLTHFIGGWVGPRADLDAVEKRRIFCSCRQSDLGRLARRPSIYRLSYPDVYVYIKSYKHDDGANALTGIRE
jgi:hypothetical protein